MVTEKKKIEYNARSVIKIKANSSFRTFYGDVYVDCLVNRVWEIRRKADEKRRINELRQCYSCD